MPQENRNELPQQRTSDARPLTATVVHDGSASRLAADLSRYRFDVVEQPVKSAPVAYDAPGELAVIAARHGEHDGERLRERTRQLCWSGATILAVGGAVAPVAELFGSMRTDLPKPARETARVAQIGSASEGLFAGVPSELRISLPPGDRYHTDELSAELSATAWSTDGELISASHVFRPVHLLHAGALESAAVWPLLLRNLLRLLRERGGRAF